MIHTTPLVNNKLLDIYHSLLSKDEESLSHRQESNVIRFDETFFDFGIKYRVVSTDCRLSIHLKIIGWDVVKDDALHCLVKHFGTNGVISDIDLYDQDYPLDNRSTEFNVALVLKDVSTQNINASHLTNIRSHVLGFRLSEVFQSITEEHSALTQESRSFLIPIQRNIKISGKDHIFFTVVSYQIDRVTVVIPVPFQDETERAFAKLFLQQLQQEQRNSNGKSVPLCNYWRSSEPPLEAQNCYRKDKEDDENKMNVLAGYFSLTFLKINVDSKEKSDKAVESVLMFYDFVDYHVKKMKSAVNANLRKKYSELLWQMKGG